MKKINKHFLEWNVTIGIKTHFAAGHTYEYTFENVFWKKGFHKLYTRHQLISFLCACLHDLWYNHDL